jgi:large subunit ribosomal protein L24
LGNISADSIDAAPLVAAMIGMPQPITPAVWSSQPFSTGLFSDLRGKVTLDAAQAVILPSVLAQKFDATVNFAPSEISIENVTAIVGGGNIGGQAKFSSGPGGLTLRGAVSVANANAGNVIRAGNFTPLDGKISARLAFEGAGATPASMIGALRGEGTVTLENGQIAGLDTKAIDVAIRAVERGTPIAAPRIAEIAARVLDNSSYSFAKASAPVEIAAGRARLGKFSLPQTNNFAAAGSIDLVAETVDARFTLTSLRTGMGEAASQQRPEISVTVKGPIGSPRRAIDVSPLVGWLTLQAVDREAKKLEAAEREAKRREQLNAEIEERMKRPAIPEPDTSVPAENSPGSSPGLNTPQAEAPVRRAPPVGIESAPLAPIPQ